MPWTYAGLTIGGWELEDDFVAPSMPRPGLAEAQAPLAWADSATVVAGEGAAWRGFGAGMVEAHAAYAPPSGGKPRAVFTSVSGAYGVDRNGILLARGDAQGWLRAGAVAAQRGGTGDLGVAGDHLWAVAAGTRRGAHAFEAHFAQRGMGASQRAGAGEGARGQGGSLAWSVSRGSDSVGVRLSRALDERDLVSIPLGDEEPGLFQLRRDASGNDAEIGASRRSADRETAVRLAYREAHVASVFSDYGVTLGRWNTRSLWLALRDTRPFASGTLETTLGAGHDRSPALARDRNVLAPAVVWRRMRAGLATRVFAERVVDPVWSDLGRGVAPFLQHTWLGGAAAEARGANGRRAALELLAGRTANRATELRYPVRILSLEFGPRPDAHRYNFALLTGSGACAWRACGFDASGYVLVRDEREEPLRVDPALGGRVGAATAFHAFSGDLGVRLRAEAAWVGARDTDVRITGESDSALPGYATFSARADLTLGDATITVRGENLEGTRHPESWIDPTQAGVLARGAGRALRAEVVWPLFN